MSPAGPKARALVAAQEMPLRGAAPFLAANGWPVYPCVEAGKAPLIRHGLLEATTDARKVERWWSRWPEANIATPTGPVSGFDVVDVDVREDGSGHEAFDRAADALGLHGWALRVLTPSGGTHLYYPVEPGRAQPNWVCAKAHVDFRGAGGAIILPPSEGQRGDGARRAYTLAAAQQGAAPIDAEALRGFLDPGRARRRSEAQPPLAAEGAARMSALRAWVAARPEGERNAGLFWAACRMAEAGHGFDQTLGALSGAARDCGLLDREILATVNSAYRHANPGPAPAAAAPSGPDRPSLVGRRAAVAL